MCSLRGRTCPAQEEVFEIESTKLCIGSGAHAVEEEFGGDQVRSFGCDWAWIIDFVASYCDSNTAWLFLSWVIGHNNSDVGCFAIGWHFFVVNESAGVGSFVFFVALEQSPEFVAHSFFPQLSIARLDKSWILG